MGMLMYFKYSQVSIEIKLFGRKQWKIQYLNF